MGLVVPDTLSPLSLPVVAEQLPPLLKTAVIAA
jgi:hypothetical protein